ncbi:MAG: thermonuclease family protein [Sphingomonadaceae bacterium]
MLLLAAVCAPGPRVHRVHDGDTVWLHGEKIRIADIDAPELNGDREYESALAERARTRLLQLLDVGDFEIARADKDRHGRTLATLHRSGRSIGAQLVSEEWARTWSGRREPWCRDG